MYPTIELIKVLDYSLISNSLNQNKLIEFAYLSSKNRMLFFYLNKLGQRNFGKLLHIYHNEKLKYERTNTVISRVSIILEHSNVEYAFFKTIRPYISTTVDLDLIIFNGHNDYIKAINIMKKSGYKLITCGPKSSTFKDKETNIGLDLYSDISVSFINYMDKETLKCYVVKKELNNGEEIKILSPEADLSCIISHSLIKEQMYTLSEYYTFINYLKQINIDIFLKIIKQNNMMSAAKTHTSITALLYKMAHKTIPPKLQQILEKLGKDSNEMRRLVWNNFETPHKYGSITLAKAFIEMSKGVKSRNSIAIQIYNMTNLKFSKNFLKDLLSHIRRESY